MTASPSFAERLFRAHYRSVFAFVRRRTANVHDAEDITQTVFVQAIDAFDRASSDVKPPLALLYTIARRRLIDVGRRTHEMGNGALGAAQSATHAEMYGEPLARVLTRAIAGLPETQQDVVVMKLLEGRSHAEISKALGLTEAASRMQLSRALTALREHLEHEGVTP